MAAIPKTITITDKNEAWISSRIESGDYSNASEYIRDLLRKDQERECQLDKLAALLREGLESEVTQDTVLDVLDEIKAQRNSNAAL